MNDSTIDTEIPLQVKKNNEVLRFLKAKNQKFHEDQLIVSDLVSSNLSLVKVTCNLIFKNCIFNTISIQKCRNLVFENCKFTCVNLIISSKINIKSSHIVSLTMKGLKNSWIFECKIDDVINNLSWANVFENCEMNNLSKENSITSILEKTGLKKLSLLVPIILIFIIPFVFYLQYVSIIPVLLPIFMIYFGGVFLMLLVSALTWINLHIAEKRPNKLIK